MQTERSPFDDVEFPAFSSLPFRKGDPPGAIWGFYESLSKDPKPDELGALNLLTPTRIVAASREEIQLGKVVSLNWPLQKPDHGLFGRKTMEHKVFKWPSGHIIDDEISMNTQSGSQWDSFCHYGHYKTGQYYNGLKESEIVDSNGKGVRLAADTPMRNGIHAWQGKIVGRGVLLDYFSYAQAHGIIYNPSEEHQITAELLDKCAQEEGVVLRQGDILFIRTGYIHWYERASSAERIATTTSATCVGMLQGQEELEWLWSHHFAAVSCDTVSFEKQPMSKEWNLHDYVLALWGTPIGELFDLEALAKTCKDLGRYSFFVTSSPLNIINGIASPPNAMAIF